MQGMLAAAVRIAVQEVMRRSAQIGVSWRLRPATCTARGSRVMTEVVLDGDTVPMPATSMIGHVPPRARVMALLVPPAGLYVVGWYGPSPTAATGQLIGYGEDHTVSQLASTITLVTVEGVRLQSDRIYRLAGSTRARATNSADFNGLITAEVQVDGTVVGRDRTILRDSTATGATNWLKPDASHVTVAATGLYTITLTGGIGNGTSNDVDWRGGGGDGFQHWVALYDAGDRRFVQKTVGLTM